MDPEFTKAEVDQELMKDWCSSTYTHHVGTCPCTTFANARFPRIFESWCRRRVPPWRATASSVRLRDIPPLCPRLCVVIRDAQLRGRWVDHLRRRGWVALPGTRYVSPPHFPCIISQQRGGGGRGGDARERSSEEAAGGAREGGRRGGKELWRNDRGGRPIVERGAADNPILFL